MIRRVTEPATAPPTYTLCQSKIWHCIELELCQFHDAANEPPSDWLRLPAMCFCTSTNNHGNASVDQPRSCIPESPHQIFWLESSWCKIRRHTIDISKSRHPDTSREHTGRIIRPDATSQDRGGEQGKVSVYGWNPGQAIDDGGSAVMPQCC